MCSCEERVTTRCQYYFIVQAEERTIVVSLENVLKNQNQLIELFKRMSPELKNDNYQIVIKANKGPLGEHVSRFKAPTVMKLLLLWLVIQLTIKL
ncbi:uncharacterized protein NPIL_651701 [Nephila pilipes]|uniref:Uncharacterized protein n=1 Tax=Nephila pilipes TaxID=299642 RepID=A0A8X6TJ89_NEPPI|nr:uncharacterized protein NPIL_651701 [Nephila pilipes]